MGKRTLILRRALAGVGALLILIGVPIGILTPIPAVPIGLTIVVLGAALLARNSEAGRKWLSGIVSRYPRISALSPNWLKALVFGTLEQTATDSPATMMPLSEGPISWRYASIIAFLMLAYVSLAAAVSRGFLTSLDSGLSEVVHGMRSAPLTDVMVAITSFGDGNSLSIFAVVLVTTLLTIRAWWPAVLSALAILATYLGVLATKAILVRDRPTQEIYSGVDAFSFPSGHMANSIVILGIAGLLLAFSLVKPARKYVLGSALVFLALMGLTRVYLGAHWPSDVVASAILGIAVLCVIVPVLRSIEWTAVKRQNLLIGLALASAMGVAHATLSFNTMQGRYLPVTGAAGVHSSLAAPVPRTHL